LLRSIDRSTGHRERQKTDVESSRTPQTADTQALVLFSHPQSAVIHLECGKKNETTTRTNKRERSTSTASREEEELFCCESCWELEKSAGDSSSITMSTVAPPAASSPLSVPPSIERNQTCTSTGAGNESKGRSPVEARHTVSPTRIFQLSQNWSSDRREDEVRKVFYL